MRISEKFTVKSPRPIDKININQATSDELVTIPYIDYEIAFRIIEYRTLQEGISNIEELTKIEAQGLLEDKSTFTSKKQSRCFYR